MIHTTNTHSRVCVEPFELANTQADHSTRLIERTHRAIRTLKQWWPRMPSNSSPRQVLEGIYIQRHLHSKASPFEHIRGISRIVLWKVLSAKIRLRISKRIPRSSYQFDCGLTDSWARAHHPKTYHKKLIKRRSLDKNSSVNFYSLRSSRAILDCTNCTWTYWINKKIERNDRSEMYKWASGVKK